MKAYGQYVLYRRKDFSKNISELGKEIASNKSSITDIQKNIDSLNGSIENTISRNEINDRVLGITNDISKMNQ